MTSVTTRWLLILLALSAISACAPTSRSAAPAQSSPAKPPESSGRALLHEAVTVLSTRALGRDRIDWAQVERDLTPTVPESGTAPTAYAAIQAAVDRLHDPHARFNPSVAHAPAPNATTQTRSGAEPPEATDETTTPDRPSQPTPQPAPRPRIPSVPEGQLLQGGIAYLVVPGCTAPDVEGLRAYARAGAAEIARLNAAKPAGWLIDLRLNAGGNIWPMLLGLHPLLGDGPRMATVDAGRIASRYGVSKDHGAWIDWGSGPETQLDWGDTPPNNPAIAPRRLAVLLGPWTMSSGEALAICLASTENTRSLGEPTAGLTTVTNDFPLSDGSILNLPVALMATPAGTPRTGKLAPDQPAAFGDWPLPDDAAALAGRRWLLEN